MVKWDLKQSDIEVLGFRLKKKWSFNLTSNMTVERVSQMKTMEKHWHNLTTNTGNMTYLSHEAEKNCYTEGIQATNTRKYTDCR